MAEPSVQVPVSLIERIRAGLPLWKYEVDPEAAELMAALDAALSQPAPTAEPCTCPPPATHLGEGPDQDCPKHGDRHRPAAPPSIADMVPGTTFIGRTRDGALSVRDDRWMVDYRGGVMSTHGAQLDSDRIDPSTIRDVTPPTEKE